MQTTSLYVAALRACYLRGTRISYLRMSEDTLKNNVAYSMLLSRERAEPWFSHLYCLYPGIWPTGWEQVFKAATVTTETR